MTNNKLADEIERGLDGSNFISYNLTDAEWKQIIAALRRSEPVLGECEECGQTIITPLHHLPSVEKDAARYRKLKSAFSVPYAMQSFIKHMNWHPDTFKMGIDEAIDAFEATLKEQR